MNDKTIGFDKNNKPIKLSSKMKIMVDEKVMGKYTEYHGEWVGIIEEHCLFGNWTPVFTGDRYNENGEYDKSLVLSIYDMRYGEVLEEMNYE